MEVTLLVLAFVVESIEYSHLHPEFVSSGKGMAIAAKFLECFGMIDGYSLVDTYIGNATLWWCSGICIHVEKKSKEKRQSDENWSHAVFMEIFVGNVQTPPPISQLQNQNFSP